MVTAQPTPVRVGIQHVLIATDFSSYSKDALHFGLQLAKNYQAKAYLVFVVPTEQFLIAGPEAYAAAKDAGRRDLQELKAELLHTHSLVEGQDYHLYLLEGDVAECILDFACQKRIDLIVLGTHGRGGLGKALLGSVAENVFRNSPVPVLTLGPHVCRAPKNSTTRNILVAADFTLASERAALYAVSLAREHKAKLTLLHVASQKELDGVPDRDAVVQEMKKKLADLVGPDNELEISLLVEVGRVAPTILQTADTIKADLIVMSVRQTQGVLNRLMWPNAYEIVREAACPVLTVRDKVLQH